MAPGPPKTIALVLAEPAAAKSPLKRLAEVIGWYAISGLRHVVVYDPKGTDLLDHAQIDRLRDYCSAWGKLLQLLQCDLFVL